jgi:hypothetical protein
MTLGMRGPYYLNPETVDREVRGKTAGNYAIGYCKDNGAFVVRYVGRSDSDLNSELKSHEADMSTRFKWRPADSAKSAFDFECKNFHDFGGYDNLENESHPEPPSGMSWICPFCKELD